MSPKKNRTKSKTNPEVNADELWIALKSNLKGENGDRAWNDRSATPTGTRLLELADIALGLKKPNSPKKRRSSVANNSSGD